MSQYLFISAVVALIFVQLVQAQLPIPLPPLPVDLPALPELPLLPVVAAPTICPGGFFADLLLCYPCPPGTTSALGSTACTACNPGFYAPGPGSSFCMPCNEGTHSSPAADTCHCGPKPKGLSKGKGGPVGAGGGILGGILPGTGGVLGGVTGAGGLLGGVTGTGGVLNGVTGTASVIAGVTNTANVLNGVAVTGPVAGSPILGGLPVPAVPAVPASGKGKVKAVKGKGKE